MMWASKVGTYDIDTGSGADMMVLTRRGGIVKTGVQKSVHRSTGPFCVFLAFPGTLLICSQSN